MTFIFIAFTGLILSTCARIPVLLKCRIENAWRGKKVYNNRTCNINLLRIVRRRESNFLDKWQSYLLFNLAYSFLYMLYCCLSKVVSGSKCKVKKNNWIFWHMISPLYCFVVILRASDFPRFPACISALHPWYFDILVKNVQVPITGSLE